MNKDEESFLESFGRWPEDWVSLKGVFEVVFEVVL